MRRLLPSAAPVELSDAYGGLDPPQRWVAVGMVGSVDGATAVGGTSGALGAEGDLAAFRALRSLVDVVVVGLGTAVAEGYRPTWQVRGATTRTRRGQSPLPRLALVTGSGRVPTDLRTLEDPRHPPLVLTTQRGAGEARRRVGDRAEVVGVAATSDGLVRPAAAIDALAARGLGRVLLEGGPALNHTFVAAGVVDEVFLTLAPTLVGGGTGIVSGALPDGPRRLVLQELRVHGSELVCRYRLLPRDER